jgi:hypothetical protein
LETKPPLDGQLPLLQGKRPETLPRLAGHGAEADALVGANLVLVVGIEDIFGECQDAAGAVTRRARVSDSVGRGVLDSSSSLVARRPPGSRHTEAQLRIEWLKLKLSSQPWRVEQQGYRRATQHHPRGDHALTSMAKPFRASVSLS